MEDEWERFQKTIQKEKDVSDTLYFCYACYVCIYIFSYVQVSEAIQFEEDEEAQVGRDRSEVQEQVYVNATKETYTGLHTRFFLGGGRGNCQKFMAWYILLERFGLI